jgi:hypothetical protein
MRNSALIDGLARALLAGEPTSHLLLDRCRRALGRSWRWLRPLTDRYLKKFGTARPRRREAVDFLRNDIGLRRASAKYSDQFVIADFWTERQFMLPTEWSRNVPAIDSTGDLAKWLGLNPADLRWFADLKALGYKQREPRLEHYHYRILAKRFGAIRLIEAPKPRLKDLQRQIQLWILQKLPAHPAAHGFIAGRSIRTFAAPHVGRMVVLRMDLRDFFPTFGGVRIQNVFRTLGYPEAVADLLGGVCTNAIPIRVWRDLGAGVNPERVVDLRKLYARPHLPQGAPTSPFLANICCYRLDCRLSAFARSSGAAYTRYADDRVPRVRKAERLSSAQLLN